jgi:hypothetical protein
MTNSDTTTYKREPVLDDINVQLHYRGIAALANKHIKLHPFAFAGLPASKESRARTLYIQPGLGIQAAYSNDKMLGGEFTAIASASYSRPLYQYTTAETLNERPYGNACFSGAAGDTSCGNQLGGAPNVRDQFTWLVIVAQQWGKWSPGVFWRMGHAAPFQFRDLAGAGVGSNPQGGSPGFRNSTYFAAWLDYNLTDWITPEVGYQFGRRLLGDSGKYGNPIFDSQQDMRVYLGASIQLDSLYKSVSGASGAAGVVRAKAKTPILTF